jgi:predicted naringenin-chalcone synthase
MNKPAARAQILAIGTAVPDHVCTQEQSLRIARQAFRDRPQTLGLVERLIRGSGIEKRHTVLADYDRTMDQRSFFPRTPDFQPEPGTRARNDVFTHEAPRLGQRACEALPPTGWQARVSHLVTASCTGFAAPGFDVTLARMLGLSPSVHRFHIGFMGCYAGFVTLKVADAICAADPDALVLIVHVELCSLHVHFSGDANALIADSLFADGAAAALVGRSAHAALGRGSPLGVLGSACALLPDGAEDMGWTLGDHGFDMALSPRVPHLLRRHLDPALGGLLDSLDVKRDQILYWAIHPGGPAILDQAKQALGLDESAVASARDVLTQHGNMSSSTLWFLLERIRQEPRPGLIYACGFGPGLTLESALLSHPGGKR